MNIVDIPVGSEGDFKLVLLTGGKIQITMAETTPGLQGTTQVTIPIDYFLEALRAKFSGNIFASSMISLVETVLDQVP